MEPNKSEGSTPYNLQEIQGFAKEKLPDPNQLEKVNDLDSLMLAQLRENVERNDAANYLNTSGNYELPCEFKKIGENFCFFIPRVEDWKYIRATPITGNHSPFLETYSGKEHDFAKALERVTGTTSYHFIAGHERVNVGSKGEPDTTPYHHLELTPEGIKISLLSAPTVYQVEKLHAMQVRMQEKGFKLDIEYKKNNDEILLPQTQEYALNSEIPNIPVALNINYESKAPHEFDVDETGHVVVLSNSFPNNSEFIYGYGYFSDQQYNTESRKGFDSLTFHFEPTARNHFQAMSGLMLDNVCLQRRKDTTENLQDIRRNLENSLDDGVTKLDDKWSYRQEIFNKTLPYIMDVQGYSLACGFKSMLNKESGELTVELLVEKGILEDLALKSILERVNTRIAKGLELQFQAEQEHMIEKGVLQHPIEIKSISKLLPIIKA